MNAADTEGAQLPLHLLATRAMSLVDENGQYKERENAESCLMLYLSADPRPTADFMTALQALPDWLSDRAVVHPIVQNMLNNKISNRIPTLIFLLDLYFLIIIIGFYWFNVIKSITLRFKDYPDDPNETMDWRWLLPLYGGALWFLLREMAQMISLLALGLFRSWLSDIRNWMDIIIISLIFVLTILMNTGSGNPYAFRTVASFSFLLLFLNLLLLFKSMSLNFAVFVEGVMYVLQRLTFFLIALLVIVIMFTQMFQTIFLRTDMCIKTDDVGLPALCDDFRIAFLKVVTMLLGEVNEEDFRHISFPSFNVALCLFFIFMFLVVIVLANVLIAIVTDSYGVIKNERAAIVFWNNWLDFVAEMGSEE